MSFRLRTQMAFTHGLIAVITVFLIVIASYILINQRFLEYLTKNQFQEHQILVETFQKAYQSGKWDEGQLNKLGIEALERGYLITVKSKSGEVIWDTNRVDVETYKKALKKIQERIVYHFGSTQPNLQSKAYTLGELKKPFGEIRINYYSTYFLTDHDLMFLGYLNNSLLWVAGISFLFSLILSTFISSKMSKQLGKIIDIAKNIANEENHKNIDLKQSYIIEIKELVKAIQQIEENLNEKEAKNKRLTADIAHELRTPLSTLQSHLEAMIEGIWQPTQDRLAGCHEEIVRMAVLVNDLEKLNKYDKAQIKLLKTKFEITEMVKNIYTNFQRDFDIRKIEFKFDGENCIINADREKMGQVIVNLISNSLKYTPEGGRVLLNINCDDNYVYIIINDNGIGISSNDLPHIFNRLYRADVSRTRTTGGSGIGLAITKAIVEAHQGNIDVVSQEGRGTEFTVILPRNLIN